MNLFFLKVALKTSRYRDHSFICFRRLTPIRGRREIKENIRQNKARKQDNFNTFSHYPHQIEKHNCLGETELTSRKRLRSCEIILKAVSLADHECVESTIN